MAHGMKISNQSGGLVVDSDAKGMHYVGQASFVTNTTPVNNSFTKTRSFRRFSITLPTVAALPVAAIRPTTDRWLSVQEVRRSAAGSATWYIDCFCSDSTQLTASTASMSGTSSCEVHVFSTAVPSGPSFGSRLYDASGNVSWDFGAKPLFVRELLQFPARTDFSTYHTAGDSAAPAYAYTTPLLIDAKAHGKDNNAIGATGSHSDSEYVFQLGSAGVIKRVPLITYWESGEVGGSPYTPQPDFLLPAKSVFLLDAADYA